MSALRHSELSKILDDSRMFLADRERHALGKVLVWRDALYDGIGFAESDVAYQGFFDHGSVLTPMFELVTSVWDTVEHAP